MDPTGQPTSDPHLHYHMSPHFYREVYTFHRHIHGDRPIVLGNAAVHMRKALLDHFEKY